MISAQRVIQASSKWGKQFFFASTHLPGRFKGHLDHLEPKNIFHPNLVNTLSALDFSKIAKFEVEKTRISDVRGDVRAKPQRRLTGGFRSIFLKIQC